MIDGANHGIKLKIMGLWQLLRPKQWIKNAFVLAPLVFAVKFFDGSLLGKALLATIIFCIVSSAVYILNDSVDVAKDRNHPKKKYRPIASGVISKGEALVVFILLVMGAGIMGWYVGGVFLGIILGYIINNMLYSFWLKGVVIIDVMSIALGFILRVVAGALAINVLVSPWLLLCTLLLALFLGFSKRRHEITSLQGNANKHREILSEYSVEFIDNMLGVVTSSIFIGYFLYTFYTEYYLMLTIPFVLYGIFRYQYILYKKNEGGSPEESLVSDRPLLINVTLWAILSGAILYFTHFQMQ